jgi:hypothetical protein
LAHLICPKHDEIIAVKAITTCYDVAHMKGVLLSTAVWCASIPVALAAFLFLSPTLLGAGSATLTIIVGAIVSRLVWNRYTDRETKRRELEDRVRNWFP